MIRVRQAARERGTAACAARAKQVSPEGELRPTEPLRVSGRLFRVRQAARESGAAAN